MVGLHHPAQGVGETALRIGQEASDTREGLLLLRIEDVEDRPDQQRVAGFLPMAAPFERPLRIDQDVGDVLDVAHLVGTFADFQQRIVARRAGIGRVEQQAMREARPPPRGERPVLALDVMDDRRTRPRQQGGYDQADALARTGGRKGHHMLRTIVAQIVAVLDAKEDAGGPHQSGARDLAVRGPARGAVGRDLPVLPRAPKRPGDSGGACHEARAPRQQPRLVEDIGRIGLVVEPPAEQRPRTIDRNIEQGEHRRAELRLMAEHRGGPLRRRPDAQDHHAEADEDLADEKFGRGHGVSPPPANARAGGEARLPSCGSDR